MSQKLFLNTGVETIKGGALHALKDAGNAGAYDYAVLALTGVVVDQETFTLGTDVYEVNVVATDNGLDTGTGGEFNNTSPVINVPLAGLAVGDVILVESEFMKVIEASASSAFVSRGFAGSTIAAHGNSITVFEAVQQVAAGTFDVPVSATAANTADDQIAAAVQFWSDGGYSKGLGGGIGVRVENGLKVDSFLGPGTNEIVFAYAADGGVATTAEGFTNGTITAFGGGVEPASQVNSRVFHTVVAGDVSAGSVDFVAPFTVSEAFAVVHDSTGNVLAWDGAVTVTNGRYVSVNNAGATDWAAGDTIELVMYA